MARLVSKVYGDALFQLASEEGILEEIAKEAVALKEGVGSEPEILQVFTDPEIPRNECENKLQTMFGTMFSSTMMGFLHVLIQKGRMKELPAILSYFEAQYKEAKGIGEVYVTTPFPLEDSQKKAIQKRLLETAPYETLDIHYELDPLLLGGIRIQINDRVVDHTIQSNLETMTDLLSQLRV